MSFATDVVPSGASHCLNELLDLRKTLAGALEEAKEVEAVALQVQPCKLIADMSALCALVSADR